MEQEMLDFINKLTALFERVDVADVHPQTEFKALDGWSSLLALNLIGMVDLEYGVIIKGDDVRQCVTVEDLFQMIHSKK